MRKLIVAASAAAMAAFAAPAYAQTIDGSIGWASIDTYGVNLNAIQGILSWKSSNFIGAEAEAGIGLGSENLVPGVNVDMHFEFAGYATATAALGENAALFARVGYAWVDADTNTGIEVGDDGLAWGVGGKFFFDGVNGIRADYTKFDFDNGDTDVYAIAYVRRF